MKAGLIGLGWWGSSLLRMTANSEALRIVAATDVDPSREAVATAAGVDFRRSFEGVVRHPDVEAVILCTPHELHAEQAISAAGHDKHVFCEKPLCLTLADAERVVQACERAGVVLGIGHERRFEPPIVDLMTRIAAGELGSILQIEGNFSQDKFLSLPPDNWRIRGAGSVGPMTATGIHLLDLSTAILGSAKRVAASVRSLATSFENGDSLAVMIDFENGGAALISAILATPFDGRFAVYGSLGWAEIRDKSHPENSEGWIATYAVRGKVREMKDYPGAPAARLNLEAFARATAGQQPYPIKTSQMLQTTAALEAVFESTRGGDWRRVAGREAQRLRA
jgi:predicted dehydrogenase